MKMGSVVFALSCAQASFHAFNSLKEATVDNWSNIIGWSVSIGATMCCCMGIGTFLSLSPL